MDENTLYAARDPYGVRPLSLGRLDRGWVVASETAALDIVGASFVRDIEPGELLAIDADGVRSTRFANPEPKGCVFEYVYLARPDSTIAGRSVHGARARDRPSAGPRMPDRRRPGDRRPGIRHPRRGRLCAGVRHPLRAGPDEERLRRADLHPAVADHPPARNPAEAQPAQRGHPRQAAHRRRRLDRAGQHPARAGQDAARGRRRRGARADRLAAGEMAVLLRHRLPFAGRADRQRRRRRRRDARSGAACHRRRHARIHLAAGPDRRDRATHVAALLGLLRRQVSDRAAQRDRAGQERHRAHACHHRPGSRAGRCPNQHRGPRNLPRRRSRPPCCAIPNSADRWPIPVFGADR